MRAWIWGLAGLLALTGTGAARAQADVQARLVETFPAGAPIEVAPNQRVQVRVAYRTDVPTHIYVQPYRRGQQVGANCGAPEVTGEGEFLTCFSLDRPGDEVDELRVSAGNGNPQRTPEIARWPLHAVASADAPPAGAVPAWVTRLEAQRRAIAQAHMPGPPSAVDMGLGLVVVGFAWAMLALGLAGLLWPLWAVWKWRGGWRVLAAIPAAVVALVLLNLVVGLLFDPSSHNLWPLELAMAGGFAALAMLALVLVRRWKARAPE